MPTLNMLSSADKTKGHGVMSAYLEQVDLVETGLKDEYQVTVNKVKLCDLTHYHTIDFKFFLSIPFAKMKGKTVAYVHFVPETMKDSIKLPAIVSKVFYKYIVWFYKSVDLLVVVNPYFIEELIKLGISRDKVTYIPNFVSEKSFFRYKPEKKAVVRRKLGIAEDTFTVLGAGQVQTRKGILDFIEVAKRLPHIQFIWAGGFSFGAITDGYKELKQIIEIPPPNLKFLGIVERENMNDIYNAADMLFLPSFKELFPMTVLESMALNLPILLRDIPIYPVILKDYYLKGNNVEEFVNEIETLSKDREYYNKYTEKSKTGHQFYSREHVLKLWKEFYDSICYEKKPMN